ncbi:MAG TPA: glutathione S-transferase [Alphaproteobacteria bacterium]|nr:glutathione S-transferase [Alphaproteobacteria bacterium]HAJ48003.1 glutathione S-transferase [Alphaproteobacteria bacterium]
MDPYIIYGAPGSPYSIKVRAAFRYKRIPHIWQMGGHGDGDVMGKVKVPVIPVVRFPDGTYKNDSTPLLQDIERLHPERALFPADPALQFLALLLEDFADEWLTKAMFHYRWYRAADQDQMSKWLAFDRMMGKSQAAIEQAAAFFRDRQVGRMTIVGCTPQNAPVIEDATFAAWRALDQLALEGPFLFGTRPSVADLAIMGQYLQLATDPTPQILMRAVAPYLYRWLFDLDDASGFEGAWIDGITALHPSVHTLIGQVGTIYFPFLLANDAAIKAGQDTFTVTLLGRAFTQGVFKYQQKCLGELRARYAALPATAKAELAPLLSETHCLATLQGDLA